MTNTDPRNEIEDILFDACRESGCPDCKSNTDKLLALIHEREKKLFTRVEQCFYRQITESHCAINLRDYEELKKEMDCE